MSNDRGIHQSLQLPPSPEEAIDLKSENAVLKTQVAELSAEVASLKERLESMRSFQPQTKKGGGFMGR